MKNHKAPDTELHPHAGADSLITAADPSLQPLNFEGGDPGNPFKDHSNSIAADVHPHTVINTFHTVFESLDIGILLQDRDLKVLATNRSTKELLWFSGTELAPTTLHIIDETGTPIPPDELPPVLALRTGTVQDGKVMGVYGPAGQLNWIEVTSKPLLRAGETRPYAVLSSLSNVSEFKRRQQELDYQIQHDTLTKLPNRHAFFEELTMVAGKSMNYAVMYLDLDGFKNVNDTYGHAVGDQLLTAAAKRLQRCIRPHDVAARLAGDEFAILLHQVGSSKDAVTVAKRVLAKLRQAFHLSGGAVTISTSIGIAFGTRGDEPDKTIVNADYALQHVKRTGKNRYAVFDQHLSHHRAVHSQIETDLKHALPKAQLEVYYQPLFDARGRRLAGIEALMRWQHPEHGTIRPAEFLPVAEKTGLIVEMEIWLLKTAMKQLSIWNEEHPELQLSINLSCKQLEQPGFLTLFEEALVASSAVPENVVLDVSESFAMKRSSDNIRLANALSELGLNLAIDDFGTGYSNLGALKDLPFDIVKIDRSFLRDVPENRRNTTLVKTILAMAQVLELSVVAEGIETDAQAHFLYWEGARWLQGFYFSPPLSASQLSSTYLNV
ncbi:MAG: EAL domain-containing protein [Trueperaceae bacterium]|nr:MAG: EAL domain-containing protein [Trueperaceae bacterium]